MAYGVILLPAVLKQEVLRIAERIIAIVHGGGRCHMGWLFWRESTDRSDSGEMEFVDVRGHLWLPACISQRLPLS